MPLLEGLQVLQVGPGAGAAVCGRILADLGATVRTLDAATSTPLAIWLNDGKKTVEALGQADMIVCEGSPASLRAKGRDGASLRAYSSDAVVVLISPYGQTGPQAD